MKTNLLLALALVISFSASSQKMCLKLNTANRNVVAHRSIVSDLSTNDKPYVPNYAPYVDPSKSAPGVYETQIGTTVYDTQSNASVENRCYVYPNGDIAAVWTMGFVATAYPERGTGYNYYSYADGMWGDEPTARIENARCGWPSYRPLGDGEIVCAHNGSTGLLITKRATRGTGAWTTTLLAGPAGGAGITWPRMTTSGNNVHIIVPSAAAQGGMLRALLYYRSTDGGNTWDAPIIVPGLDAASIGAGTSKSFNGFSADSYNWAEPKGDTIAFVVADNMGGVWVMKSYDNGSNWEKLTIQTVPVYTVAPTPILWSNDGSCSMALDSDGKAHVVFGRMRNSDDAFTTEGNSYYPYTDGLIYWTEGMAALDTVTTQDDDYLINNGYLIGSMLDYSGNDTIDFPTVASGFPFGLYGSSLSSMGQISIDDKDNIFVTYSSCREDLVYNNANPNAELYRHVYTVSKEKGQTAWTDPTDLMDDIEHSYDEGVCASLSPTFHDGKFHLIYHVDPEPGTAVGSDGDTPSDTYVNYLNYPTFVKVKEVDLAKYVQVSPNPATDHADVVVSLVKNDKVQLDIYDAMGRMLSSQNYGNQLAGYHTYTVNTNALPSGIYMFTIKVGENQTSKKVVVK